ncbi:putative chromatin regulator PHD family [Dioscorea sansibarensis]
MATAPPPGKRACVAGGGELKRIAEIVMVLSTIGTVRASRDPSPVECSLVAEAKARLASLCAAERPKDLFPKDAVMALVKDLGLNSASDRFLRSRPQRMSIAEKFLVSRRKMEESKDLAAHPVAHSSLFFPVCDSVHPGLEVSTVHQSHNPIVYKPGSEVVFDEVVSSSAVAASVLPAASPTSLVKKPQVNEKEATMATALSDLEASVAAEKFQEITTPGSVLKKAASPSAQLTAAEVMRLVLAKHLPAFDPVKNEVAHGVSFMQTPPGNLFFQNAVTGGHETNWTPPSTDYIDKSLNCQICKTAINDVESLLVCDACERGTHMKCLPPSDNTELAQDEWYCPKCLTMNSGKPFVPKYGRVRRFVGLPKASPAPCRTRASSKRRAENSDSG